MKRMIFRLHIIIFLSFFSCQIENWKYYNGMGLYAYIPKDLDDCIKQLLKILSPQEIEEIKNGKEEDMLKYHFGLGLWIRNEWGLWAGSRLADWFHWKGIYHPDYISSLILVSFWRYLNNVPIDLDGQIKYYKNLEKNYFK